MEQNSNYITVELVCKIQCQDYRVALGVKRIWIISLVVGAIQIGVWILKAHHLQ